MDEAPNTERMPYVTPRLLQVQRRADGDNLAGGCKVNTEFAVGGELNNNNCSVNGGTCFDAGS
jgi:hypothetical protein